MFFFYSITYTEENLNLKCIFGRDLSNIYIFHWRDIIHVLCIQLLFPVYSIRRANSIRLNRISVCNNT